MGKTLDALLGRNLKASKFKTLAKLSISRISILKKKHEMRYSHARSDVKQLLHLGQQESALLRVILHPYHTFLIFSMLFNIQNFINGSLIESVNRLDM